MARLDSCSEKQWHHSFDSFHLSHQEQKETNANYVEISILFIFPLIHLSKVTPFCKDSILNHCTARYRNGLVEILSYIFRIHWNEQSLKRTTKTKVATTKQKGNPKHWRQRNLINADVKWSEHSHVMGGEHVWGYVNLFPWFRLLV